MFFPLPVADELLHERRCSSKRLTSLVKSGLWTQVRGPKGPRAPKRCSGGYLFLCYMIGPEDTTDVDPFDGDSSAGKGGSVWYYSVSWDYWMITIASTYLIR